MTIDSLPSTAVSNARRPSSRLRFQDAVSHAGTWGEAMLDQLDRLGTLGLRVIGKGNSADPSLPARPVNRPSWSVVLVAAAMAVMVGFFGWAAFANSQGGDTWRTAPGVGDIEINSHLQPAGSGMVPGTGNATGSGMPATGMGAGTAPGN